MGKRPLVYLDHNILDFFTKGKLISLKEYFKANTHVIYSAETLKEISRSPEYADAFLIVLKELNAKYMEVILDEERHVTDLMKYDNIDPFKIYQIQLANNEEIILPDIDPLYHKLMGGQKNLSFAEAIESNKIFFNDLLSDLDFKLSSSDTEENILDIDISHLRERGHETFEQLKEQLNTLGQDEKESNIPNDLRNHFAISPNILNNLNESGVIKKIIEIIVNQTNMKANFIELIFVPDNPDIINLVNPNNTKYQKVCGVYSVLQMFGYWPDKRNDKNDRFISFQSDQFHVANAIFTKALVTRDKALAKKAGATYEYLGIGTKVIYVSEEM